MTMMELVALGLTVMVFGVIFAARLASSKPIAPSQPSRKSVAAGLKITPPADGVYMTQGDLDQVIADITALFGGQRKADYDNVVLEVCEDTLNVVKAHVSSKLNKSLIPPLQIRMRGPQQRHNLRFDHDDEKEIFFVVLAKVSAMLLTIDAVKTVGYEPVGERDLFINVEFRR